MAEESKFKRVLKKIKGTKHIEIIIAVIAVVIMLVLYFSTKLVPNNTKNEDNNGTTTNQYCREMETKLQDTLSSMKGVGKTKIIINWESSVETVAEDKNSSNTSWQGSSTPNVLKEIYPKALGVIIICQGGDDVKTRINIINAVSVLLNITPDKIIVYAMTK